MERKMRGGVLLVKTRQVPGIASLQVSAQFEKPAPPKIKIHSVAGHDEIKDAPTDSPEWEEFARQAREVEHKIDQARSDFLYDYAVEEWSWDGGKTWLTDSPDDWVFPAVFARHGIKPSDNRRVDYIRYELITDNADLNLIYGAKLSTTSEAAIAAAEEQFPGDGSRRKAVTQPTTKRGRHKG